MYHYVDPTREAEPHAQPDLETFESTNHPSVGTNELLIGWYYAYGFPGCLWDSDPVGPFKTEGEALNAAREDAGTE